MTDLTVDVERLTYGFDAIARHDGQVVFVPYGAPGDRVTAAVTARKRDFLRAEITAILTPGPDRVAPPCPAFGVCGGCQWQHVSAAAQRAAKTALVRAQLTRAAATDVVAPILYTDEAFGYRGRIALVVEGRALGFHRRSSHALVAVDQCPVAAPPIAAHVATARDWVAGLRAAVTRVTIALAAGGDGVVFAADASSGPGDADDDVTADLCARVPALRGAIINGPRGRRVIGDPTVALELEPGCTLDVPADCFTQVNPRANQLLVATVLGLVAPHAGQHVFDGYCGAGNFTLPLARHGARVVGVERAGGAIGALVRNAARMQLDDVTARTGDTAAVAAEYAPGTFDAIVIDPPRAGAADAIAPLATLRAPRIVYVSCDPATLARDISRFAAHGYRLARAQPIDLFPQSYHVETVAELLLT